MKKDSAFYMNIFLFFILFHNASGFYEAIECNIYTNHCNKMCGSPEMHEVCRSLCNRLFKIWTGLDFMQSIQTAIPKGSIESYMLLSDAISILYDLRKHNNEKFKEHHEDLEVMHSIIKHLNQHNVVAHLQPLKKIIELCHDAIISFGQIINQNNDNSQIMIL